MQRRLQQIESTSNGTVAVEVAGSTSQGREIYTARVGDGDEVVLIESQIHGNQPLGAMAELDVLKTLGGSSPRAQEIRDAVTVVVVPQMNADGAALDQRQSD